MSGYIGTQPVPQATQTRDTFTATAGQTSFATSGYTPNYLDVFLNGVHLVNGTDYTASNGSDVVLTSGAAAGDSVEVVAYTTFQTGDFVPTSGGTFSGNVAVNGNLTVDTNTLFVDAASNNVGIGTSSPAHKLDVNGNIRIPAGGNFLFGAGNEAIAETSGALRFFTNGSDSMVIDAGGRVTTDYQPMFSSFNLATGSQYPSTYNIWATFDSNLTNFASPRYAAEVNVGSHFSTSNGRFTAPVTGRYLFSVNVPMWVGNTTYLVIFKNGTYGSPYQIVYNASLGGYQSMTLNRVMTLAAGDYVEPGFYASSGTYATYIPGGGYLQFSGHLIG